MKARSDKRIGFLASVLTGAIESGSLGWFSVSEYRWENMGADAYAVVIDDEDETATPLRITLDTIARGLSVIRSATMGPAVDHDGDLVLTNARTGQRMYLNPQRRKEIMLTDRTNGDNGDLDAIDYLAIVECGLFGAVTYA